MNNTITNKNTSLSNSLLLGNRWVQLAIGVMCMALVANLQYGWTLFVEPIADRHHWSLESIQFAFTIFGFASTWLVPIQGWFSDRFGPRPVVFVSGIFTALGWILNAHADSLGMLYFAGIISGLGSGGVYGTCLGCALKWFPDNRGLAAGLAAAGFGAGGTLFVVPITHMIQNSSYEHAFIFFGLLQGIGVIILSFLLLTPEPQATELNKVEVETSRVDYSMKQMLKTPVFWVIYIIYVAAAAGGVVATAELATIARNYDVAATPITLFGLTLPVLAMALSIDNIANGFSRPVCGFISDKIGRENTMFVVFIGQGLALLGLMHFGHSPLTFVICAALLFMFWGEIFSLFPATCGDTFGSKYASGNAAVLYTAKGTAGLVVPLASYVAATQSWDHILLPLAIIAICAGIAAKLILAPMRHRFIAAAQKQAA
ncbi:MAG TPA: oxalate/formate MFS antiporter [Rhodocyclaceae bacterium]|nr:oxalate/formate MFS antiporter [Rhodocyclaceae bacterium]